MSQIFTASAVERLQIFLQQTNRKNEFTALTPDASTREYFRVAWNDSTAIACVYPESFSSPEQNYKHIGTDNRHVFKLFAASDFYIIADYRSGNSRAVRD